MYDRLSILTGSVRIKIFFVRQPVSRNLSDVVFTVGNHHIVRFRPNHPCHRRRRTANGHHACNNVCRLPMTSIQSSFVELNHLISIPFKDGERGGESSPSGSNGRGACCHLQAVRLRRSDVVGPPRLESWLQVFDSTNQFNLQCDVMCLPVIVFATICILKSDRSEGLNYLARRWAVVW
jgi:hypothetical protein